MKDAATLLLRSVRKEEEVSVARCVVYVISDCTKDLFVIRAAENSE